jgi:hypothetical protein
MNLTFGEYRASDQNTLHYQPPLEKLPPFTPWPRWELALNALVGALGLAGFVCGVLAAGWA